MVKVIRKYTDKERYLEEYQNLDLTPGQYAREKGIPPSTLSAYLHKERFLTIPHLLLNKT